MRFFISLILLNCTFFASFPAISEPSHSPETISRLDKSKLSIWRIDFSDIGSATAFSIRERLMITNFHAVSLISEEGITIEDIILSQEGHSSSLKVKRILALSSFYDLALMEVEGEVSDYLNLREDPVDPKENLFLPAYPNWLFKRLRKTGEVLYKDNQSYAFPVSHSYLNGTSGGPILDEKGQIVGVVSSAFTNIVNVIRLNHLKKFIEGDTGLNCSKFIKPKNCVKREMENLENLAEGGSPYAQYMLAEYYHEGKGIEQNYKQALFWRKKAAEQAYIPAQHRLAYMYYTGKGIEKNDGMALSLWKQAAEQDYTPAQHNLAYMYYTKEDLERALSWWKKAGEQGYALSQHNLFNMYLNGKGTEQNYERALYWLKEAAEKQGYPPSQHNLALYYSNQETEEGYKKAISLWREAAEQGYAVAQNLLGIKYYTGEGVEEDHEMALFWWRQAAEQGHADAKQNLQLVFPE